MELLAVQKKDPFCRSAIVQLGSIIDSSRSRKNKWVVETAVNVNSASPCLYKDGAGNGDAVESKSLSQADLNSYRLNPLDGVLEFRKSQPVKDVPVWLPYIPAAPFIFDSGPISWRCWLFDQCHSGLLNAHRPASQTYHLLRKMAYWPSLARDTERWCSECNACVQLRSTRTSAAPMKSVLGDEKLAVRLPWQDITIDCCGPYTRAESGEQYILVYICTQLKVPMLEPFVSLQSGHFSRALVKCVLRTRVSPDVVRSDRGPEMVSQVNQEFLAICNARHKLGAALTPRHQGLCERNHQVMMGNQNILMSEICKAHPQEWPALIPVVEYLQHTAPQGAHGFSAHDMCSAYSVLNETDARLAPFRVPSGFLRVML